ncbi:MAG TPA: SBBP repeat-containing protein [Desulfomonilia bacterium]
MRTGKLKLILVLMFAIISYTACGGGGSDSATPPPSSPTAPSAPGLAPDITVGDTTLTASWLPVTGATAYEVYYSDTDDPATAILFASTSNISCVITGLTNGTEYFVWVKAKNSTGISAFSPAGSGAPSGAISNWPAGIKQYGSDQTDYAIGMVKDKDGNIYVTGYSSGNLDPATCTNEGGDDIYLVKYNPSGIRQWTCMLGSTENDRPYAIAYDGDTGIYLAGYTRGLLDGNDNPQDEEIMFIAKYSTDGSKVWTKVYETAGSTVYAMAWHDGYIYVTGMGLNGGLYKLFIAKYNDVGVQEWLNYYAEGDNGHSIALDSSGNIYVTVSGSYMTLYKYNSLGVEQWNRPRADLSSGRGIVVDEDSNIYFTGTTTSSHSYIVKYDSSGNLVWENTIQSLLAEGGNAVALDSSGNVYVTGGTRGDLDGQTNNGNGSTYDMFLIKYDIDGTRQWTRLLGTNAYDAGAGLTLLSDNYVLVYGHTEGALGTPAAGGHDYLFAQYNASGVLQ